MTLKALQIFVNVANIGTNLITSMNYYNVSPGRKRNLTEDPSAGIFNNHRPVSGLQGVEGAPAWILYEVINSSLDIVWIYQFPPEYDKIQPENDKISVSMFSILIQISPTHTSVASPQRNRSVMPSFWSSSFKEDSFWKCRWHQEIWEPITS